MFDIKCDPDRRRGRGTKHNTPGNPQNHHRTIQASAYRPHRFRFIHCCTIREGIALARYKGSSKGSFHLSKDRAVLAVYAALYMKGILSANQLNSYSSDGTFLGEHPEQSLDGIELSTGSLGHGLSIGAGIALAIRMRGERHGSSSW